MVSPRSISELERGSTHWPRVDTINLLADGLDLTGPERAALMLTDAMLTGSVPDAVHDELAKHFTSM